MTKTIGIRREDKNEWERRVPLIPSDIQELRDKYGIKAIVQPSKIRIFSDDDYSKTGTQIDESLSEADAVFAVKEIPIPLLEKKKTYVFFSHTIKGQPYNMKMLKRLMELKCNLIDYERMSNGQNARIITFSGFAGMAGMIESLYAYGCKMKLQGYNTPFEKIKQAYQYDSIDHAREEIGKIGREISQHGLPSEIHPLIIGILGYGNVSKGAQSILDILPLKVITPDQLLKGLNSSQLDNKYVYKTVFEEKDMVTPLEGAFNLQDYYGHPEKYESKFHHYLPSINILVNCVYWTEKYPRLVTRDNLKTSFSHPQNPGPQVIGDISCDINGSIEITKESTKPDNACYTYLPENDTFENGIQSSGVTVMAIDNLPCEFPREASSSFSSSLIKYASAIASADYESNFQDLSLPKEIKKAVILLNGELTPDYQYIADFL